MAFNINGSDSNRSGVGNSYVHAVLVFPDRDRLLCECPALATFLLETAVAAIQRHKVIADPLPRLSDEVKRFLGVRTVAEMLRRMFSPSGPESSVAFWSAIRDSYVKRVSSVIAASETACEGGAPTKQTPDLEMHACATIRGKCRLPARPHQIMKRGVLMSALHASRRTLKAITASILAGSTKPLQESAVIQKQTVDALTALLHYAKLISPLATASEEAPEFEQITSQGLAFCMSSLQQQWWTLVEAAVERAVAFSTAGSSLQDTKKGSASHVAAVRGEVLQLLAVLDSLDGMEYMFPFPHREEDPVMYQILARLSEVGLVYPVAHEGLHYFVISPHFSHALALYASAPLCMTSMLTEDGAAGGSDGQEQRSTAIARAALRREDEDTIITETNFRLYAYTRNEDMLNILAQFAVHEATVEGTLVCFRVTRHSFIRAVRKGITAAQVLQYLSLKAHPAMLAHYAAGGQPSADGPRAVSSTMSASPQGRPRDTRTGARGLVVPQSFCDQLTMWERECRRVVYHDNVVLLSGVQQQQAESIQSYLEVACGVDNPVLFASDGNVVIRSDVYEEFFAPHMPAGAVRRTAAPRATKVGVDAEAGEGADVENRKKRKRGGGGGGK